MVSEERKNTIDKRAKSIAAMSLVIREGDKFKVSTPSLRGRQTSHTVWRDNGSPHGLPSKVKCNCLEFEEEFSKDASFRCEHILAVKYHLENVRREQMRKDAENESIEQTESNLNQQEVKDER